jgi:hypothetical protein
MESEHIEQVKLIQWWGLSCRSFGLSEKVLFAIPNGGERNVIVAGKLKAEGVRAGVPDLFLAHPSHDYHGLFIEMKKEKGGRVSSLQNQFIDVLSKAGYYTSVCHGWYEAAECIKNYLR